jgi:hypothetical protein
MKLPLWYKTKDGKWRVFPYHRLTTFPDGKVGVTVSEYLMKFDPELLAIRHLLDYHDFTGRMTLKDDKQ